MTATGPLEVFSTAETVAPSPSSPYVLSPQHQARWLLPSAQACRHPASAAVNVTTVSVRVGVTTARYRLPPSRVDGASTRYLHPPAPAALCSENRKAPRGDDRFDVSAFHVPDV